MSSGFDVRYKYLIVYIVGVYSIGFFAPLLSYFFSIFGLVLLPINKSKIARRLLVLSALLSFFVIYASRDFEAELREDLSIYYLVYEGMKYDFSNYLGFFGGGFEIGWPVFYKIVSLVFDVERPEQLSIINTFVCVFLFYIWVEYYLLDNPEYVADSAIIWAFIIAFMGIVTLGYLQRQAVSTIFILFSLYSRKKWASISFLFLAVSFHITAIVFYFLYSACLRYNIKNVFRFILFLSVILLFFRIYFYDIAQAFFSSSEILRSKFLYYSDVRFSISSHKTYIINCLIFSLLLLRWSSVFSKEKNIILISTLSYVLLAGIPLMAERLNFIGFYLLGFYIYFSFLYKAKANTRSYMKLFIVIYTFIYVAFKIIDPESVLGSYWASYSAFGLFPLYFMY